MSTLLEDPMPIIFLGIVVETLLAAALLNTRRGVILLAMLGVLVLVLAGVGLESLVVTEVERVEAALDGAADALEANDLARVLEHVASSADQTRGRAEQVLGMIEFNDVKIHNLRITVNRLTSPPTAEAEFNGIFAFRDLTGQFARRGYAARFTIGLRLEGDRWLITNHIEHHDLRDR